MKLELNIFLDLRVLCLLSYASPSEVPSLGKDADYSNSHVFSMDVD
jgi:hypothetical protein